VTKIEQLRRNMASSRWRLNHLYKIVDKKSQVITFRENPIQKRLNASKARKKIVLKARQHGITTNEILKMFDNTVFNRNVTNTILAHENDAIKKIFRVVRRAYKYLHPSFKPRLSRGGGSKYEMYFPDTNSLIYCDLESRGDTINWLHCSEAAFMDEERFISTSQAVPLDGRITLESTANGIGNFFYETWVDPESTYKKFFFPWFIQKEYRIETDQITELNTQEKKLNKYAYKHYGLLLSQAQIEFRRQKKKDLRDKFAQEYPEDDASCFLMSGRIVCDGQIITQLINDLPEPKTIIDQLTVFDLPENGIDYIIAADTAQGLAGGDFCAATVINVQNQSEAAFYHSKVKPIQFARDLFDICHYYSKGNRRPLLVVEKNNHGHAVLQELFDHKRYPNLYHEKEGEPGWLTTSINRPIMLNQFIDAVEDGFLEIRSKVTLREMLTLVNKNGKIQAADGKHDDGVMATAIGLQVLMTVSKKIELYDNIGSSILV